MAAAEARPENKAGKLNRESFSRRGNNKRRAVDEAAPVNSVVCPRHRELEVHELLASLCCAIGKRNPGAGAFQTAVKTQARLLQQPGPTWLRLCSAEGKSAVGRRAGSARRLLRPKGVMKQTHNMGGLYTQWGERTA